MVDSSLHTPGAIGDYFAIEGHLVSTRSADAYQAVDKTRGSAVCLWILRHPLPVNSEAVRRFHRRLTAIHGLTPRVSSFQSYGIDNAGMAFAVFQPLDGHSILDGNVEAAEAERRLLAAAKLIDRLHQAQITCGDLCGSSFWIDRNGDVKLLGVLGSFDAEAAATAMVPPLETMHFLAPEQRSGAGIEPATDVFALGVLGYRLLTHRFPLDKNPAAALSGYDIGSIKPISAFIGAPPMWAEEVIFKCLDPHPEKRYSSAGEFVAAIATIRQKAVAGQSAPLKTKAEVLNKKLTAATGEAVAIRSGSVPTANKQEQPAQKPDSLLAKPATRLFGVGIIVALIAVLVFQQLKPQEMTREAKLQEELSVHRSVLGNEQLRQAIDVITESEVSINERAAELDKIVNSDDPLVHDVLVKSAKESKSSQLRALSEKAIVDRSRRLGLIRSAEQIRQWLRTLRPGEIPVGYEAILQSLDTTLPAEAHNSYLRQAYASNPPVVLRLAAALALDTNKFQEYQSIVAQLIGDAMKFEDVKSHSTLALVLSSPDLAVVFGDDIIQRREQIPDADILWLLKLLAERSDSNVRAIASAAVERGILSQVRGLFLSVIRDRGDLPPDVMAALIRAAAGILKVEDISTFGRWYDVQSEKVLLAVLADSTDQALLVEAFDNVSGKSLSIEPAVSLVDWVRKDHWDNRGKFAHAIGVLSFLDLATTDDVVKSLQAFDKYIKDSRLVEILLETRNTAVIRTIVEQYSDLLGLGGLINLLDYPEKDIRISAVKALKGYNDISALKIIVQQYDAEKDPDVRQAYKDSFWMIKERQ